MHSDSLRDQFIERRIVLGRAVAATVIVLATLAGLSARLLYLQVTSHDHYQTLSEENRIKLLPIPPTRGMIYDRNGVVLAENVPTFSLDVIPERVDDLEATLDELGHLVALTPEELARFHALRKRKRRFERVTLKTHLTDEEIARVAVKRHLLPGVDITGSLLRNYPLGELTSHVVGYIGRISERELQEIDATAYAGTDHIGKSGLEKSYESQLLGEVGVQQAEINASGRIARILETEPPVGGNDLHLHLDVRLQRVATDALGEHTGSVVAIDPVTGGVLALVSHPGFDPNPFVEGISHRDYAALRDDRRVPLFNRAIQGSYPPGSTVKPFIGLAGLEKNAVAPLQTTWCPGQFKLKGSRRVFRDWKRGGHGHVDLDKAITQSCDVYFYDLAYSMGIDSLHDYLSQFGFGTPTGVDLPLETGAVLPSKFWKQGRYGQVWLPGDTVNAGIGQGYFLTSPMQLAYATAVLAAGGKRLEPLLVARAGSQETTPGDADIEQIPWRSADNWHRILEAMVNVVETGTARRIRTDNYRIAGKTGTAQVVSMKQNEEYDETKLAKEKHDHALFISFAPADAPRIAVAVIVENGGHGGATAAPVAGRVMDYYLGEILGMFPLDPDPESPAAITTADSQPVPETTD
jgi:penicillin-binding protein 2